MSASDQVDLFSLSDLCTPWCVHVVATLRIADRIDAGVTAIPDLAAACDADAEMLALVLDHLIGKGVFVKLGLGHYGLNESARQLLAEPLRLGLDLDGIGGRMALAWSGLLRQVRTGMPAYHEIFGLPFWEDLDAHPELGAGFDALMGPAGHGAPDPEVLVNSDWDDVHWVVDVGGGTGALLAAILQAHPGARGTLVDFPRTVANATETFEAAGVAERTSTSGQSFFDPLPSGANLYVLSRVLHDWPDREATDILRRCAEAVAPNGRVVVVGGASLDDRPPSLGPETVLVGGKNRNLEGLRSLVGEAGLTISAIGRQPTGRSIVECRRVR